MKTEIYCKAIAHNLSLRERFSTKPNYTLLQRKPRKFFLSKEELYDLYWNKNLSIRTIAKQYGVRYNTVYERNEKV